MDTQNNILHFISLSSRLENIPCFTRVQVFHLLVEKELKSVSCVDRAETLEAQQFLSE